MYIITENGHECLDGDTPSKEYENVFELFSATIKDAEDYKWSAEQIKEIFTGSAGITPDMLAEDVCNKLVEKGYITKVKSKFGVRRWA